MPVSALPPGFSSLPLAELHLHLEGSIAPATVVELAARHGIRITREETAARYSYANFAAFIESFKWVTRLVRQPSDFALITQRLGEELLRQSVVYAEVTISAGVMLLRQQDIAANMAAIAEAGASFQSRGLKLAWILDVVRQFGGEPAIAVARAAASQRSCGVVALGIGGDELARPLFEFRPAFDIARDAGLHIVAHAGEIGGPDSIREAIAVLGAERIGHGIAAINDPALCDELAARQIPLEICPTSNLATGALALQLANAAATINAAPAAAIFPATEDSAIPSVTLADHPLKKLYDRGLRVTLSTDDPAMFHTTLLREYGVAASLGFLPAGLVQLAESSFHAAFLPPPEKLALLRSFRQRAAASGLL